MAGATIRDAADADLDALGRLEVGSFPTDRMSPRSIRRLLGRPSAVFRVAVAGKVVLGYSLVLFRKGSPVARLYSIAVDGSRRRSGLGRRLLADAERAAAARGGRVLRLEVRADNASAIRLYERQGYRPIGRRDAYYADGEDALRFEKALAGPASGRLPPRRRKRTA